MPRRPFNIDFAYGQDYTVVGLFSQHCLRKAASKVPFGGTIKPIQAEWSPQTGAPTSPSPQMTPQITGLGPAPGTQPLGAVNKSPTLPGFPGSVASNPIDTRGGLDRTGRTVDGNHAAGISKGAL